MASIKDTGTGGININGDVYTMDVFEQKTPEDDAGGRYGNWNSGDIKVDKTKKDISTPTKETFAKYLSKTTLGKEGTAADLPLRKNPYPVGNDDSTSLQEISLRDIDGNPMKPSITPNESSFAPEFNETIGAPTKAPVKKGYSNVSDPNNPDGNLLLRNATVASDSGINQGYVKSSKGLTDPLKGYVSQVLKVNRFNPIDEGEFAQDYLDSSIKNVVDERFDENSSFVRPDQLKLGMSPGNNDSIKRDYGFKKLAKIAPVLQKNATYLNKEGGSPSITQENSNSSADGGNLISNLDLSLPAERLNVENIIKDLSNDLIDDNQLTDFSSKFETTINNLVDRFSGLSNESQIATAAALVSATINSYLVIDEQVKDQFIQAGKIGRYEGKGRSGIGSYFGGPTEPSIKKFVNQINTSSKTLQYMNIRATSRPFKDAVRRGMNTFFSVNTSSQKTTLSRPLENVSYTIVLARSIIRSSIQLSFLIKEINESANINGIEKSLEVLKIIRDSRLIGIFNFFAHIGDVGLDPSSGNPTYNVSTADDNGRKISLIDSTKDGTPFTMYGKSRIANGKSRKLSWSINRTPDVILSVPTTHFDYLKELNGPPLNLPAANLDPTSTTRMEMVGPDATADLARISNVTRRSYENKFEAEYVPFYFHDVRTNEIIGFHAFITSLTEDYSAAYESVEGFGRVEPVKIYKNTQRKISLSFVAAALDSADFDAFWYKINKLTTLLYPQYTSGKRISHENFSFIKPFTQAIGASPLVRLRLGNLITTNYSKFNLSKVFGLHEPDTVIMGIDRDGKFKKAKERDKKLAKLREDFSTQKGVLDNERRELREKFESGRYRYDPSYTWVINDGEEVVLNVLSEFEGASIIDESLADEEINVFAENLSEDKTKVLLFTNPSKYLLGIKLEAIVAQESVVTNEDTGETVVTKNGDDFLAKVVTIPLDPDADFSREDGQEIVYVGKLVKLSIDDTSAYEIPTSDITEEERNKLQEERNAAIKIIETTHKLYEIDKQKGKVPDIEKYKFTIGESALYGLTLPSYEKYQETIKHYMNEVDIIYNGLETEASLQFAIDSEEAIEEYKESILNNTTDYRAEYAIKAKGFMDEKNNSIVRSFQSAGGKGLAGFIESMQFDWMGGTWDTSDNRKAPMFCKITMTFSPIHDIPPGLSSDGQNRAPIYPIGANRPKTLGE